MSWHRHPGVRSGQSLTLGERAADKMRNGMGSWGFVFTALAFLGVWMFILNHGGGFDPYPFILLNLVLSCLAAMQGAILLIAAKRSDQIAAELAQHDLKTDVETTTIVTALAADFALMNTQHAAMQAQIAELHELLVTNHTRDAA